MVGRSPISTTTLAVVGLVSLASCTPTVQTSTDLQILLRSRKNPPSEIHGRDQVRDQARDQVRDQVLDQARDRCPISCRTCHS